jgi:ABC-type multidrug transport system ATPase subunit
MVQLENVTIDGIGLPLELALPEGGTYAVVTRREEETRGIVRLLLGGYMPVTGRVRVAGLDPVELKGAALSAHRRRIGVVWHDGGLVSNLTVRENLTLQQAYFGDVRDPGPAVDRLLEAVGFRGAHNIPPSRLTLGERRLVGLARALLAEPRLLVCQSVCDGMGRDEQQQFSRHCFDFHRQGDGRTVLFLTANAQSLREMPFDRIVTL